MSRQLWFSWVGLVFAAGVAQAQLPFTKEMLPSQTALAKIGLQRHWFNAVPIGGGAEKVSELSIDDGLVFVQTNQANFHVFDAESGRLLWSGNFGRATVASQHASANSTTVFFTNSNILYALNRTDGRVRWNRVLEGVPGSPTTADEDHVWVGLVSGKLLAFDAKIGKPLYNFQTRSEITSRPRPAGRVIAFASHDGKVYTSRSDVLLPLMRWGAGGPVTASLGAHGVRDLLVPSQDGNLYGVDLFNGETKWIFPAGAPIAQEPLVAGDDLYVVNVEGMLSLVNANSGEPSWTISTLGGPLLGVSPKRLYLESQDGDLFIVDRTSGAMLYDPRATHERAGVNIREFQFGPTNRLDDRMYLASKSGMLLCLREANAVKPVYLRNPKEKPFGYIPPEGYPDAPKIPSVPILAPADAPAAGPATDGAPK